MSADGGNNWYVYTIYGVNNPRVIFNNSTTDPATRQQHPVINQPRIEITEDEMWVVNETAYSQKPQGITVHFVLLIGSIGTQEFTPMKIMIF